VRKRSHFGWFLTNVRLTQMVNILRFNHTWYVNSLLMGNYYCGVRNFWKSLFCTWRTKTHFLKPKSCLNDTVMAIVYYQSNHQCFLVMVHSQKEVEVQYCDKRLSFPGVTARNLIFFRHLDRFPPQAGNIIYRVFWWELAQHITAVSKPFWYFTLATLH